MSDPTPEILIIEPSDATRQTMVLALRALGHSAHGVTHVDTSLESLQHLGSDIAGADIVVLCLAGEDCLHLARNIHAAFPGTGIIMLTAGTRQNDKVGGYDSGADIYLTKPASAQELSAAIHSLARRVCPTMAKAVAGLQLILNSATLQLKGPNATVDVSDAECSLLSAFATATEQRLHTDRIMEVAGRPAADLSKSALEVQIVRLRKKLEQAGASSPCIKAIRGTGYQLCVSISIARLLPLAPTPGSS